MSTLSTHILDISTGTPAEGVTVSLNREGETLANTVTNAGGVSPPLAPRRCRRGAVLNSGNRGVVCPRRARSVFTRAQIDFVIGEAAEDHFHLPFLVARAGGRPTAAAKRGCPLPGGAALPGLDRYGAVRAARRPGKAQPPPGMYRWLRRSSFLFYPHTRIIILLSLQGITLTLSPTGYKTKFIPTGDK